MSESTKHASSRKELKERITIVAQQLFGAHGIKSITMDEVATNLSISKRTLYEVFPDKETLLMECIKHGQYEGDEYMRSVVTSAHNVLEVLLKLFMFSIEKFHATNPLFFTEITKYPKAYNLMMNKNRQESEEAVNFFKQGVNQGIFRDDINFHIMHILMREQFNTLLHTDICAQYSFVEVYESIMFTQLRGICTERGAHELEVFIEQYRQERDNKAETATNAIRL